MSQYSTVRGTLSHCVPSRLILLTLQVTHGIYLLFDAHPVIMVLEISAESCVIVVAWASPSRLNVYFLLLAHKLAPERLSRQHEMRCEHHRSIFSPVQTLIEMSKSSVPLLGCPSWYGLYEHSCRGYDSERRLTNAVITQQYLQWCEVC